VLAWDTAQGFMLLEDLGHTTMMQALQVADPQANLPLYLQAIDALILLQKASRPGVLPAFDRAMIKREMELFPQWYLTRHRGVTLDEAMQRTLDQSFEAIASECLAWPMVYVHSDFMPRNLMLAAGDARIGVLDFQDAVHGPITYDLVSLLKDAYVRWDEAQVLDWTVRYWERARAAGLPVAADFGEFYRDFEWMGLQRHLKVLGIFARLHHRDRKDRYLADLPRVLGYVRPVLERYHAFAPLARLFDRIEGGGVAVGYTF
jgi:hypothetical protein